MPFKAALKAITHIAAVLSLCLFLNPAQAGMIANQQLLQNGYQQQVIKQLNHPSVKQQLIDLGVDPVAAQERVEHMTTAELTELQQQMDQLPAGASLGGTLVTVFIVLVITDMLGATDIFPFVKNINK